MRKNECCTSNFTLFWESFDFLNSFNAIESNHLLLGGGLNDFFVQSDSNCRTSESDRQTVEAWLRQQPEVSATTIGPLVDAWYGSFN